MGKLLKQGVGWRLGWDSEAADFKGLAGTEDWAVELTEEEFADFCRLLAQLVATVEQMAEALMAEEAIACETSTDLLWMQVSGYPQNYDLYLIVLTGRQVEARWPAHVLPGLIEAAQVLQTSLDSPASLMHVW
ncbi:MAG: DUF1818 family protein [Aphanocapsa sp. GSE-SYN-MK-11-07L]|nr:DUF1818 family protein [Aphanocapsa sp. GSE-SYN-MK-11-07L]